MLADLALYSDRCSFGFHLEAQHPALCSCIDGEKGKALGIAASNAKATPEQKAQIDAVIRRVAARGQEFSANDVRTQLPESVAPFMGGRFSALSRAGVIKHVGYKPSSKGSTHSHDIKTWKGAAAA